MFVWVYFARPEDWIPGLGAFRPAFFAGALAIVAFVLATLGTGGGIVAFPREIWYLIALFVQLFAAAVFSPVWRGGAFQVVAYTFSKIVVIAVVISLAVTTLARLRKLIFIQASSFAIVAAVSVAGSQKIAGRLTGSLNGIYGNPNDLAFTIALGFPMCWIFLHRTRNPIKKMGWILCLIAMAYCVFLTASRGGLIVLLTSTMVGMWEFGFKGRRRHVWVIGGLLALTFVAIAPTKLMETRFASFVAPAANETAYGSFEARRGLLLTSLHVTGEHPLFGVGPGNFLVLSGNWHGTHNSLTELSAEGGIAALILFLLMIKKSFSNLHETENYEGDQAEIKLWRSGLKVAMITLAVGSLFASVEYLFFPYMLMAYTSVFHRIANEAGSSRVQAYSTQPVSGSDFRSERLAT